MRTEFLCISVLRVASGPRVKLASCKSALNPPAAVCDSGTPWTFLLPFFLSYLSDYVVIIRMLSLLR